MIDNQADAAASPLLRGLRAKFIALNMALATLVLAGSFAAICYMDHRSDIDEVYRTLSQALNRSSHVVQLVPDKHALAPERDERTREDSEFTPPEIGGGQQGAPDAPVPTAVYYWSGATVRSLSDQSSASVPESVLPQALQSVLEAPESHGYLEDLHLFFAKRDAGPDLVVAFADGAAADAWQGLAWGLAGIGVGALGVLLLLNLLFSRWALRPVQRAWVQQQQFIADASHELKTPLTVILANNAILRQRGEATVASQDQWIESTQVEAERMQALVSDLLDLARPTAPAASGPGESMPVDFSRLVEGEALTFEAVAFERELIWESAIEEGVFVHGNGARLQRATAVLLDNACKYTEPGGTVTVTLQALAGDAILAVRNSGAPIDATDLPHLFDRFYRADKARTHNAAGDVAAASTGTGGYGLGLAIAQDIAHAHKGSITATSTAEEGTAFTLRIPLG